MLQDTAGDPVTMDPIHNTDISPAVSFRVSSAYSVLSKRSEFLAAARASKQGTKGMMVQARQRHDGSNDMRVGFTCSKKVGNSVARNRAKRRLREVARAVLPVSGRAGWDYVLIGRFQDTAERDFQSLIGDFQYALNKLHEGQK